MPNAGAQIMLSSVVKCSLAVKMALTVQAEAAGLQAVVPPDGCVPASFRAWRKLWTCESMGH